ncbi:MAG: hypothetical protein CMJ49_03575 [Planctomycetaceae bacterium]|nr:hypothetical protein [Planctomycetaceae bacterium]
MISSKSFKYQTRSSTPEPISRSACPSTSPSRPPDNIPAILSGANASFTNEILLVRSDASPDDLTVALHDASYIATVLAPGEAEPNTWTSFAWVRDVSGSTSTSTIYVDGIVRDVRTNSFDGALSIGLDGLYLGNDQDVLADAFTPANQFHGVMDNAYFYNRPLSEIEIRNLHGIPAPSALLAGLGLFGALAARRHRKT